MNKQLGKILYVDSNQFQKAANTDGLIKFFNEMRLTKQRDLLYIVESLFQNGSGNRSHFFLNMAYREYASYAKGFEYRMPFYGVKGRIAGMTRALNYTELLTCKREELEGTGFTDLIFGTNYMTAEQGVADSDAQLLGIIQQDKIHIPHTMKKEEIADTCMVLEKLWEAQEADPTTRFIIRMKDPDEAGFALLKNMYRLLPQGLRLQLGFETNVTDEDLQQIHQNNGIPIYVLTTSEDSVINEKKYDFPIVFFDYENRGQYSYHPERMKVLEKTADEIDDLNAVFLDYAEKKTMEDKQARYSSFKFYEDTVDRANDSTNYWWKNEEVEDVEALKAQFDDQRQLLNNDQLYKDAMVSFLTNIMPKSNLGPQMVKLLRDKTYPNRNELLRFLMTDLSQKTQINAMAQIGTEITAEKEAEKQSALQNLAKQYQADKAALQRSAEQEKERAVAEITRLAKEKIDSLEAKIEKLQNTESGEFGEMGGEAASRETEKLERDLDRVQSTAGKLKIGCIVCGILCAAAIAAAGIFMAGGSSAKKDLAAKKVEYNRLSDEKSVVEQEKQEAVDKADELQKALDEANAKLEELSAPAEEPVPEVVAEPVPAEKPAADEPAGQMEGQGITSQDGI